MLQSCQDATKYASTDQQDLQTERTYRYCNNWTSLEYAIRPGVFCSCVRYTVHMYLLFRTNNKYKHQNYAYLLTLESRQERHKLVSSGLPQETSGVGAIQHGRLRLGVRRAWTHSAALLLFCFASRRFDVVCKNIADLVGTLFGFTHDW